MVGDHDDGLKRRCLPARFAEQAGAQVALQGGESKLVAVIDPDEELDEAIAQATDAIVENEMSHAEGGYQPEQGGPLESPRMKDGLRRALSAAFLAGVVALGVVAHGCAPPRTSEPPSPSPTPAPTVRATPTLLKDSPPGSVLIPGGRFTMGGGERIEENPPHLVIVPTFAIDTHEVTVERFSKFIAATGHRTEAEKWGWSGVFDIQKQDWKPVNGATWKEVGGPGTKPSALNDPVTHVSWNDAVAFCAYEKGRLPTEAEWEYAARGGKEGEIFPWGNELRPGGKPAANWWQGVFPSRATREDGFLSRAPVGRFKPNGYGLYDMIGNVWEWNADWFDAGYYLKSPVENPKGPATGKDRVMRGGSWMCSENFCRNFRNAARSFAAPDSGLDNLGFRCAYDIAPSGP